MISMLTSLMTSEIDTLKIRYFQDKNLYLSTRRILAMAFNCVAAEDSIVRTDYALKLMQLAWNGDNDDQVRKFYNSATDLLSKVERCW